MGTFWITKYALSGGIKTVEAEAIDGSFGAYIKPHRSWVLHYIGKDAFTNIDDASGDAERRRVKKIASLKKQIAKLENLDFSA